MSMQSEGKDAKGRNYDQATKNGGGSAASMGAGGTGEVDQTRAQGNRQADSRTDDLLAGASADQEADQGFAGGSASGKIETGMEGIGSKTGNRQSNQPGQQNAQGERQQQAPGQPEAGRQDQAGAGRQGPPD
ncbi:hypothetical protein [Massilia sp. H6]|uniref:hypothetical protein n=1 Tax=Massilia sp. H6 TaxID=2970464 RepID=UPI0021683EB6|nr:hypothetical protein [Massilia sp. H6]UVW27192.1 hypothetical protein NRS07_11505 [Massilia sp. H6]